MRTSRIYTNSLVLLLMVLFFGCAEDSKPKAPAGAARDNNADATILSPGDGDSNEDGAAEPKEPAKPKKPTVKKAPSTPKTPPAGAGAGADPLGSLLGGLGGGGIPDIGSLLGGLGGGGAGGGGLLSTIGGLIPGLSTLLGAIGIR